MGAIVYLLFFRDELMPGRDSDVDTDAKGVAFLVRMVGLFDCDIAPADVVAKLIQSGRLLAHHLFDAVGFHKAAITDIHRQLHKQHCKPR